ncbi:hypothetical protein SAMN05428959_105538 [Duganella sp. CF517]|uniref:hypothetical protein n=1 Tax=Duganella sp. CF517 TaxID=1881038 RepID=UPI0008D2A239|nr:hypothetical protein [Duganella sp. CF517]SEO23772.1 hypothetical protein SAMN05428959_105538 [Duganella sp. CF517]
MTSSKKTYTRRKFVGTALGALVAANLAACGGGGGGGTTAPTTPPAPEAPQKIDLGTTASRIVGTKPVTLTATLGRAADVTWALGVGSLGTLSATTGASVTYTPPAAAVSAATPVTITATSAGVTATAKLALMPDPRQRTGLALLAGSLGGKGLIDGQGTAARFLEIGAMDVDRSGNLVVADLNWADSRTAAGIQNQFTVIRVVSPSGNVLTAMPTASLGYGHADGGAATAQTGKVSGLAAAPNGDIYFVDNDGGARLRVLRGGQITTLQSNLAAARVVIDRNGNIYLYSEAQVLRASADGATATVLAGAATAGVQADGQGAAARFWNITDATTDANGDLYVADGNILRKISRTGLVTTVAGVVGAPYESIDGDAATARFGGLLSVSLDNNGNLVVLEEGSDGVNVRQVTPAGVVSTLHRVAKPPATGLFPPYGSATGVRKLRFNSATRTIQLAREAQIDQLSGGTLQPFAGFEGDSHLEVDGPGETARFVRLSHLAADLAGNLYTLEFAEWNFGARMEDAHGLWLRKVAADGTVSTVVADKDFAFKPNGIVVDADGNVFLSARPPQNSMSVNSGGALYKVTAAGAVTVFAGTATRGQTASTDGTGAAATFIAPKLEGIDIAGNLYVSDVDKFRKVTPQAVVTTIAALPAGLNAAPNGLVYTADAAEDVIYATDAAGKRTVAVGAPGVPGIRLGALPAGLYAPAGIVPTGPNSFAVISGAAVLRLLLPN